MKKNVRRVRGGGRTLLFLYIECEAGCNSGGALVAIAVAAAEAFFFGRAGTAAAPLAARGVELVAHGDFELARVVVLVDEH